jgi:hypothetical protein
MKNLFKISIMTLSCFCFQAFATSNNTKLNFEHGDGVNSIRLDTTKSKIIESRTIAFARDGSDLEKNLKSIDFDNKDGSKKKDLLKIVVDDMSTKTNVVDSYRSTSLDVGFIGRLQDGGWVLMDEPSWRKDDTYERHKSFYYIDLPLKVNGEKIQGSFSILIAVRYNGIYQNYGVIKALAYNDPYVDDDKTVIKTTNSNGKTCDYAVSIEGKEHIKFSKSGSCY